MFGKLYGENLNENGNFTIVGHNYDKVFKRLDELEVGDEFYVQDIKFADEEGKSNYKITEIVEIDPTDLSVLLPKEDKTEMTLITCKEGATARLMVKAEIVPNENNTENVPDEDVATNE